MRRDFPLIQTAFGFLSLALLFGCQHPYTSGERAKLAPPRDLLGLTDCETGARADPDLNPGEDVTVLVHGCNSSAGRFETLANVFEFHGQRAICFSYDYRDSMRSSADELRASLLALENRTKVGAITVIGHSQGGLVAREALVESGGPALHHVTDLITISTPFAGIRASADCGKTALHVLSFGITIGICQAIAGRKWTEIHPRAPFILEARPLSPEIGAHHMIMTDETGACLRTKRGRCVEKDSVFSLAEQASHYVKSPRSSEEIVAAGHVEIVGEQGVAPEKLIRALQKHGALRKTEPSRTAQLGQLLARLYSGEDTRESGISLR